MQGSLVNYGVDSMAFEFLVVRGKVFNGRDHSFALNALDVSHRQAAGQIGIFSVPLKISSPERRAVDIHRWSQNHVSSQSFHFLSDRLPLTLQQLGIPGGGHGDSNRKGGGGNSFGSARRVGFGRRSGPRADADRAVGHLYGRDTQAFIGNALHPIGAAQHCHFLLQRHAAQQILNALIHRQARIFIGGAPVPLWIWATPSRAENKIKARQTERLMVFPPDNCVILRARRSNISNVSASRSYLQPDNAKAFFVQEATIDLLAPAIHSILRAVKVNSPRMAACWRAKVPDIRVSESIVPVKVVGPKRPLSCQVTDFS